MMQEYKNTLSSTGSLKILVGTVGIYLHRYLTDQWLGQPIVVAQSGKILQMENVLIRMNKRQCYCYCMWFRGGCKSSSSCRSRFIAIPITLVCTGCNYSVPSPLCGSSFAASRHRGFFKGIYQKIKIQK